MLCVAVLLKRWAVRRFAGSGRHALDLLTLACLVIIVRQIAVQLRGF